MKVDDCYQLGYIIKPHGLKGEVLAFLDVDFPEEYENLESVLLLRQNELVPFFVEACSIQPPQKARLRLEDIESREQAEELSGSELYLPLSNLPDLTGDQFYYHEVIGFSLLDQSETIGSIENVISTGRQDLFTVRTTSDKEVLIPITEEVIQKIDRDKKQVITELPAGLVDVFS